VFRPDLENVERELLSATLDLRLEDETIRYQWSGKLGGDGGTVWKDERPQLGYREITSDQVLEKLTDLYLDAPKLVGQL
jgi:hypothetical protein